MADMNIPKAVFELLVQHLVNMEEERDYLLAKQYLDATQERDDFKDFMSSYITKLDEFILKINKSKKTKVNWPFVIVGSIVEVKDMEYNEVDKYHIVSPFATNSSIDMDSVSYLSPMGKALVLKKIGDKVTVETPMGEFTYMIQNIEIPEEMFTKADK